MKLTRPSKPKIFWKTAVVMCIAMLLCSCASTKKEKKEPFLEKWQAAAQQSKGYAPSSGEKSETALSDSSRIAVDQIESGGPVPPAPALPQQTVSLEMVDVEIGTLLRALARATNQNMIINEKVRGKASINIQKAPWDQVFLSILRTHGLNYAWEGEIIRIMTAEDMEEALKQQNQKKDMRLTQPLKTLVVPVNYAEAKDLKGNLEQFLTKSDDGKPLGAVMVDEHTNSLILYAIREDIQEMVPLVRQLDRPTAQVLIEAHIVEATSSTARELGIQWGGSAVKTHGGRSYWIAPNAGEAPGIKIGDSEVVSPTAGYISNFPVINPGDTGLTLGFVLEKAGASILQAQLSALQEEKKVNILSSPSITTLDNQEAIIESGTEIPYQTVENKEVKIEFKKAVLSLIVTPHVIDNKMLKLKIDTKKDEPIESNNPLLPPSILSKKAVTNVLLFDGQTTVIGGLGKDKNEGGGAGVPGFKDIPLLGYLFKNSKKSNAMEDLLIFITPHILKEKPAHSNAAAGTDLKPAGSESP